MKPQMKTFYKNVRNDDDPSLEQKFNEWSNENPGIQIISTQFFPFNKINEMNVVSDQYMCLSVVFFRPDSD